MVAMVASPHSIVYTGAFGQRDVASGVPMTEDTIFRIYSMTKPITSVAALQLVEQGRLRLDDPVQKILPSVADAQVLTERGELRPPKMPVTVRHLLTHTSGFAYPFWSKRFREFTRKSGQTGAAKNILVFDPGEQWLYGTSTDVLGRVIEAATGVSLDVCFRKNVFDPIGMQNTSFNVPSPFSHRLASSHQRQGDGTLREEERKSSGPVSSFSGGSGLYGTAGDYASFMQMILRRGRVERARVLQSRTLKMMTTNQIGSLEAGRFPTAWPELSNDVDFHPGFRDKFGFGFLINQVAHDGGRSRGSLAWAGAANTYFWIDPEKQLCAVLMMQILPFFDGKAVALLRAFERAVYAQ